MKVLFVIAAMLMGLPSAFAQMAETSDQVIEHELGPMSNDDINTLMLQISNEDGLGHGGGHGGGGHGGGGHGGPGDGHGGGGHNNQVTCFAKDFRGNMYRAEGWRWNWQRVQRRAVQKCERWSRFRCRALGCR